MIAVRGFIATPPDIVVASGQRCEDGSERYTRPLKDGLASAHLTIASNEVGERCHDNRIISAFRG
jgi:hypothetical protein